MFKFNQTHQKTDCVFQRSVKYLLVIHGLFFYISSNYHIFKKVFDRFLEFSVQQLVGGTVIFENLNNKTMTQIKEGMKAPLFSGKNQNGEIISLEDFKGKKVVLYFYPKDNTSGCTAEACNLNDNYGDFQVNGFEVIGVSPDGEASHKKFVDKFGLQFNLIADTEQAILKAYGVWGEKSMYGKTYMGVNRTTFIINEEGIIDRILRKVDTKKHSEQIFKELNL